MEKHKGGTMGWHEEASKQCTYGDHAACDDKVCECGCHVEEETTEAKHSSGPWRIGFTARGGVKEGWAETDVNGPEGCFMVLRQYHSSPERDANARLIARAPDLLAENERLRAVNAELVGALKGVIERAHDSPPPGDVPVPYYVFQHARAALARASEGK